MNNPPMASLPASVTAPPRPASILGLVINILLGMAELCGFGIWMLMTLTAGSLSSSTAKPGPQAETLLGVGAPGLLPFGLAAAFCGIGIWKASKGSVTASLAWACAAFVIGLIPLCVFFWFLQKFNYAR